MRLKLHYLFIIWFSAIFVLALNNNTLTFEISQTHAQDNEGNSTSFNDYSGEQVAPTLRWNHTYGNLDRETVNGVIRTKDEGFILIGTRSAEEIYTVKTDRDGKLAWERSYNTSNETITYADGFNIDGFDIIQTFDEGFLIIGSKLDIILLRTDANGILRWNKAYGVPAGYNLHSQIEQATDGGFVLLSNFGEKTVPVRGAGTSIIKTDGNGVIQWNQTFIWNDPAEMYTECSYQSFIQTQDQGLVLIGTPPFGGGYNCLTKLDRNGVIQWIRTHRGFEIDSPNILFQNDLIETFDGGFAIVATMHLRNQPSTGDGELSSQIMLVKMDMNGLMLWNQSYAGSVDRSFESNSLAQTTDGGFVIVAQTYLTSELGGDRQIDILIIKTDKDGFREWDYFDQYGARLQLSNRLVLTTSGLAIAATFRIAEDDNFFLLMFDHPDFGSINPKTELLPVELIAAIILFAVMLPAGFYLLRSRIFNKQYGLTVSSKVKETINSLFNGNSGKYLLLVGGIDKDTELNAFDTPVPKALFESKFLLHPVRLAMMKFLTETDSIVGSDLRSNLGVSWGEFSHHLPQMKKRNLIEIEDRFIDGISKQTIIITSEGRAKYTALVTMLSELLSSPDFDLYSYPQDR